ncbi:MAG: hypothetical protein LBB75_06305 [Oscillospiraceae bacterium]|jgi:small-conductance mechanosensitive channel|nr:hypothetical protein [Oscillospiraceae bacterium]
MAPMKEEYVPNEKYRNMFGVERNGYGCERVDLYLAQLEVAFKKIREDNRSLKRDLAAGQALAPGQAPQAQQGFSLFPPDSEMAAQLEQQGQYIMQLQAQLAEQQERNQRLGAQMAQMAQAQPGDPQAAEALMAQMAALRGEADALRRQLRAQGAAGAPLPPAYQISEEEQQGLIGKVLVEARAQAEAMVSAARQEAELMTHRARQKVDQLRAEQERVHSQLQGISYGLRNVLRESAGAEYQQRGEEYAAS